MKYCFLVGGQVPGNHYSLLSNSWGTILGSVQGARIPKINKAGFLLRHIQTSGEDRCVKGTFKCDGINT